MGLGFCMSGKAQFAGNWFGSAETQTKVSYNSYLIELDLAQKGNRVSGAMQYFFGPLQYTIPFEAKYLKPSNLLEIADFKIAAYFSKDTNSPDCKMDGYLYFEINGPDTLLTGLFNPIYENRNGCPSLWVSLRRQNGTDTLPWGNDSLPELDLSKQVLPTVAPKPLPQDSSINPTGPAIALVKRGFDQGPVIEVEQDSIVLMLYDNGAVDNDTVSVFYDRGIIAQKVQLGLSPIQFKIVVNEGEHEIALFAENLGKVPPNTALLLVYDGLKRYTFTLSSNYSTNGVLRIKKKK
ncbi:MAG: hypothetical protein MUF24_06985 [Chitinophagaceae bacterium]|nr:hypothetical protein [Chitinophagaceae bacterium]